MRVKFLGTGPASGWPAYGYPKEKRRRPSTYLVECGGTRVFLDAGSWEAVAEGAGERVDAVLLSHAHVDHWAGLNFLRWGPELPVYSSKETFEHPYFKEISDKPFSLKLTPVEHFKSFEVGSLRVTPFPLNHVIPATGFLVECGKTLAYALDTRWLPEESLRFLKGKVDYLIIDAALPKGGQGGHNSYDMALELALELGVKEVFAVHLLPSVTEAEVLEEAERLGAKASVPDDGEEREL